MDKKLKTWDHHTNRRLMQLHPSIRQDVANFINAADKELGIRLRITADGHHRTFEEQSKLYAQGRTEPGRIVTNAQPGQSFHNYGLAIDVVEIKNGQALWNNPRWEKIGAMGEKYGFEWGGRWQGTLRDLPHFQKTFGKTWRELLAMKEAQGNVEYIKLV